MREIDDQIRYGAVGEEWDIVMLLPGDRQYPSGRDDWKMHRPRSSSKSDLDPHTVRFRRRILTTLSTTVRHEVTDETRPLRRRSAQN
jgi:hypothetical protein